MTSLRHKTPFKLTIYCFSSINPAKIFRITVITFWDAVNGITNKVIEVEDNCGHNKDDDCDVAVELEHCVACVHFAHIEKSKIKNRLDFEI